jgi:hypothetical protein
MRQLYMTSPDTVSTLGEAVSTILSGCRQETRNRQTVLFKFARWTGWELEFSACAPAVAVTPKASHCRGGGPTTRKTRNTSLLFGPRGQKDRMVHSHLGTHVKTQAKARNHPPQIRNRQKSLLTP